MNYNEVRIEGERYDLLIATLHNGNVEIGVMGKGRDFVTDTPENYWVGDASDLAEGMREMISSWEYYELASEGS